MNAALDYLATLLAWLWFGELAVLALVVLVYACTGNKQRRAKQTERTPAPVIQLENHRHDTSRTRRPGRAD
mgnify:CR=1 FL=1